MHPLKVELRGEWRF